MARRTEEYIDAARCYLYAAQYCKAKQLTQPMPAWARDQAAYWPWPEEMWQPSEEAAVNLRYAISLLEQQIDKYEVKT